jgi:pimeloyl-ACP methyl ester carboxylesterase
MRIPRVLWFWAAAVVSSGVAHADDEYRIVSSTTTVHRGLTRTEHVVQVGAHPVNRFLMYRVSAALPAKAAVVLAPSGVNESFREYELGEDYASTFVGWLAGRGVEVYGLSRRGSALAAGTCSCASGVANCRNAVPVFGPQLGSLLNIVNPWYDPASYPPGDPARTEDCSIAAGWGMAADVRDLAFIRAQARAALPGKKVVIGGLSNGGYAAYAAVSADPEAYDGLFAIDIGVDPEVLEHPTYLAPGSACRFFTLAGLLGYTVILERNLHLATLRGDVAAVSAALTRENAYACTVPPYRAQLITLLTGIPVAPDYSGCRAPAELDATLAPFLAAPDPFVYTLTSHLLFGADNGAYLAAGDPDAGTLTFASRDLAAQMYEQAKDAYVSIARQRDSSCNYAGDPRFIQGLGSYTGPVLTLEAGRGLGTRHGLLERVGSTDITQIVEPELGHVDFNWSSHQERDLHLPIYRWLVTRVLPP